jgi:hypothetical protein
VIDGGVVTQRRCNMTTTLGGLADRLRASPPADDRYHAAYFKHLNEFIAEHGAVLLDDFLELGDPKTTLLCWSRRQDNVWADVVRALLTLPELKGNCALAL